MLRVRKLDLRAKVPEVAHAGEDLGYDLFALENTVLKFGTTTKVRTGIAAQAFVANLSYLREDERYWKALGLLIRDRSSMASKGIVVNGGVLDSGYTGEISVLMTNWKRLFVHDGDVFGSPDHYLIKAGDKIAQMIPLRVLTGEVVEVEELGESSRGSDGFGSTGK